MKWPCKRNVCAVCKPGGLAFDHFDAIQDLTPLAWASKSPRSEPMVSGLAFNHFDVIQAPGVPRSGVPFRADFCSEKLDFQDGI